MDMGFRFGLLLFVGVVVLWVQIVLAINEVGDGDSDSLELCSVDLGSFLPLPYSGLSNGVCKSIWNSYILRYSQTDDHVVTIVLSALYTTGWVGMGFSKDGMMYNASAMVGWVTETGVAKIKQYHVEGFKTSEIIPDKGNLPLTSVPPFLALHGETLYLAFQMKFAQRLKSQPILFAYSSNYPEHHRLTHHDEKTTIQFDFSAGNSDMNSDISDATIPDTFSQAKKTHGMLSLLGWGLILPYGAIIARHLRQWDPLWYYLHVFFQFSGFLIAVASVVVGVSLYNRSHADAPIHRGLGIFVLVLSILQVLAFFLRPSEDSKMRRYWNWYHHWVGRIALFFGAMNIVLGIQIGDAGIEWKIGYGFILGTVLLSCIVLEALSLLTRSERSAPPPVFQPNTI